MPQMEDPNFRHTLTYIIDHGEHGALGFVVNRNIGFGLSEVFDQMNIDPEQNADTASPSKDFGHGVCLSSSRDILVDMACGKGPDKYLVLLGHSGWGPGQLELEMSHNAWLNCPADDEILFDTHIDKKLGAAASALGVDLNSVVTVAGHA